MKIFNTLSNTKEDFVPIKSGKVGMYTCGPTVYDFVTIGNWRTYTLGDLVYRAFAYRGYDVDYIMNITDVGHLTGDNQGDASQGEDRMEKAKRREGKNAWDVAEFYTQSFVDGFAQLNLVPPRQWVKATDHIDEQIELIQKLEEKGFTYTITDGVYFDVGAYEAAGNTYGELSTLDHTQELQSRIEPNAEKKDARDFALWKFNLEEATRDMEWESPWGVGFPGWHIECSAMSMKYLGEQFDIHIGGEDLRETHHPNEIAQSEGATCAAPFVKYWIHGLFLLVDGGRMGKSIGNAYNLDDITEKGFDPLALRYFYLSGHYRTRINFTWESLTAAANALEHLRNIYRDLGPDVGTVADSWKEKFVIALEDDLNMPEALATAWDMTKDADLNPADTKATLLDFDQVFGLELEKLDQAIDIPAEVQKLLDERATARNDKDWHRSDALRDEILAHGFVVKDTDEGQKIIRI